MDNHYFQTINYPDLHIHDDPDLHIHDNPDLCIHDDPDLYINDDPDFHIIDGVEIIYEEYLESFKTKSVLISSDDEL
ncbi:hypothetical protein F8M41_019729 [Gigaspora margarita]|uniref:Uncharacterized protein n=1 Tax=Gigaspora margarita TaxID=4874 RepID=A0A8H4AAU5_GIGMA|nr:hypothetical protein F8M41_024517 [Gigaspora margarita]KAF0502933.1 hypothetical protein F8M41_019729 [Gigaspora margarita]